MGYFVAGRLRGRKRLREFGDWSYAALPPTSGGGQRVWLAVEIQP